jgi:hypothetical protein
MKTIVDPLSSSSPLHTVLMPDNAGGDKNSKMNRQTLVNAFHADISVLVERVEVPAPLTADNVKKPIVHPNYNQCIEVLESGEQFECIDIGKIYGRSRSTLSKRHWQGQASQEEHVINQHLLILHQER